MWRLPAPTRTAEWTYARCISGVLDVNLKARLTSISPQLSAAATAFATAAANGTISDLPTMTNVGTVTGKELSDVYTHRFARKNSRGRMVYDEIMSLATNDRCPMCGHRQVASLDHFLPKASYPALTVVPLNLVPACSDCNKWKLDQAPANADEVMVHPYFDDIEDEPWLVAEVVQTAPASVQFSVAPPAAWDPTLTARVHHQFDDLHLSTLYASQAAEELLNIRHSLENLFNAGGVGAVTAFLDDATQSRAQAHTNSWQTAMYTALSLSHWFCNGGFL